MGLLLAGDAGGHGSTLVGEGIPLCNLFWPDGRPRFAAEAVKAGDISAAYLGRFDQNMACTLWPRYGYLLHD